MSKTPTKKDRKITALEQLVSYLDEDIEEASADFEGLRAYADGLEGELADAQEVIDELSERVEVFEECNGILDGQILEALAGWATEREDASEWATYLGEVASALTTFLGGDVDPRITGGIIINPADVIGVLTDTLDAARLVGAFAATVINAADGLLEDSDE